MITAKPYLLLTIIHGLIDNLNDMKLIELIFQNKNKNSLTLNDCYF